MRKMIIVLTMSLLLFPLNLRVNAAGPELAPNAKSAIIIEASTGDILYEKNSHAKYSPASMTKMMSILLFYEQILNGSMTWDEMVTVSDTAAKTEGSTVFLEVGEQMTVRDLFKGIAIASGNDATVAMAERVAGTEAAFVDMMNQKAQELGLKDTFFSDSTGLADDNHYSSAYDMSVIARELVRYEDILKFTSTYEDYLRKGTNKEAWLVNTNRLVRFYKGMDGLKTGYTPKAGFCLSATAKINGMRVISVVMGEPSSDIRNSEVRKMMDYAFNQYQLDILVKKDTVLDSREVYKGKIKFVNVVPRDDVTVVNKKGSKPNDYQQKITIDSLKAPIKVGDQIGSIKILLDNKVVQEIPLTVSEDVKKADIIDLFKRYLIEVYVGKTTK